METIHFIIAGKIVLAVFLIYRIQFFLSRHRSGEISLVIFIFCATIAAAMVTHEMASSIGKWVSLASFFLLGLLSFEPELGDSFDWIRRHALGHSRKNEKEILGEISRAAGQMAESKTGALIAFEQKDSLLKLAQSGIAINADVKKDLLTTLFFKDTATHDGCLLIRNGRISHCAVVLPLTTRTNIEEGLGTRHRAAIGLTEHTDAVCLVVSEEEGTISLAKHGKLYRRIPSEELQKELKKLLTPKQSKRYYPFHYTKYFAIKQHTFDGIQFSKSFGRQMYDVLLTVFFLLLYVMWNPTGFPKSIESLTNRPWVHVPFTLFVLNLIILFVKCEFTLNGTAGYGQKEWRFMFIPLFKKKFPLSDVRQVLLRRENPNLKFWSLLLNWQKRKPIVVDRGSSFETLGQFANKIRELLRIELIA